MRFRFRSGLTRLRSRERGSVAVEFAILFPVLVLLIFGIIDYGHAWYMRHMMSDACREAARYGSHYVTNNAGDRVLPSSLSPSISNYALNTAAENGGANGWGLRSLLPTDANPTVTPSGPGWTETNISVLAGEDLTVTIRATKTWFILGSILPGFGDSINLSVSTTMRCE